MAKFDESKVINTLHMEEAEIGKTYWFSDTLLGLKFLVEHERHADSQKLSAVNKDGFYTEEGYSFEFVYPYGDGKSEDSLMTHRQFAEWMTKGFGQWKLSHNKLIHCCLANYGSDEEDKCISEDVVIRRWDSDEWITPTLSVYNADVLGKE